MATYNSRALQSIFWELWTLLMSFLLPVLGGLVEDKEGISKHTNKKLKLDNSHRTCDGKK